MKPKQNKRKFMLILISFIHNLVLYLIKLFPDSWITNKTYWFWIKIMSKDDPIIKVGLDEVRLYMNISHKLSFYYNKFKKYDRALPRICLEIKKIDGFLQMIDIGSNIGDTLLLIANKTDGDFLCVEGDKKYLNILNQNLELISSNSNVYIESCYCGNKIENIFIERNGGTAKIILPTNQDSRSMKKEPSEASIKTLDTIISQNSYFDASNVLKIDTDGFEIDILSGGSNFILKNKPLIFLEMDVKQYEKNGKKYQDIIELLIKYNYRRALFYDNYGVPRGILELDDYDAIKSLVLEIESGQIHYFDILAYNNDTLKYKIILENESKM